MQDNERIVFIDYIRVIACFLVMLGHASECFYAGSASGLAGDVAMVMTNEAGEEIDRATYTDASFYYYGD